MKKGFLVRIDWSQTDHTTVFAPGAKTMEEAIAAVKKTTDCPRVYGDGSVDKVLGDVNIVAVGKEDYIQMRVGAEQADRFFEWDISENWPDYDDALNDTSHDDEALNIEDWEANLRKVLSEIDLTDAEAVQKALW